MTQSASRRLSPAKAIQHAVRSVVSFAGVGIRFSLPWTAILFGLGLADLVTSGQTAEAAMSPGMRPLEFASAAVGLIGFCSIAVNWNRFVLRDEMPAPGKILRLDEPVWRYAGNTLLLVLMAAVPVLAVALVTMLLPAAASLLTIPAAVLAGTFALVLSIRLPAVALGRKDFGFKDAFTAAHDNFWPLMGIFLINVAIALGAGFALILVATMAANISFMFGALVGLLLSLLFNVFYTLFSISIVTSLYGFFVEHREF